MKNNMFLIIFTVFFFSCNSNEPIYQETKCTKIRFVKHFKELYDSSVVIFDSTNQFKSFLYSQGKLCCNYDSNIPDSNYFRFKIYFDLIHFPSEVKNCHSRPENNKNCITYGMLLGYADGRSSVATIDCSDLYSGLDIGWISEAFAIYYLFVENKLITICDTMP